MVLQPSILSVNIDLERIASLGVGGIENRGLGRGQRMSLDETGADTYDYRSHICWARREINERV